MSSSVANGFGGPAKGRIRPDEQRIGRRYEARRRRRARALRQAFLGVVAMPTVIAAAYFFLWAEPRYVSETEFIVRSVEQHGQGSAVASLQGLLQAFQVAHSADDSNAVIEYLMSRDAVRGLEAALPLRKMYAREEADAPARFPRPFFSDTFERLYWYYKNRVTVFSDPDTGIITVQAEGFRPEDAQAISRQLLSQAEALVNAMNARLEADTVGAAQSAVGEAEKVVLAAQAEVDRFRHSEIVVDPTLNAVAQLETITSLSTQVDQVLAQIAQNNKLSPSSPTIAALKVKADSLLTQIGREQKSLAGSQGAVADKVTTYERLTILRTLADASLTAARLSLDTARTDVRRQHVFVEQIVAPNLPDYPTEPRRLRSVATVFAITVMALAILWLLAVGLKESES
jgi:capsular polysaccharide transport system permease protein